MGTPLEEVASTPFVASWLGRARDGDLFDPDQGRRASAWAHWALSHLNDYKGFSDRPYVALTLPGLFYDPRGEGTGVRPHLEVSSAIFRSPDELFPDRLAQAGNGMLFEWWMPAEVVALKRAVLGLPRGDISPLLDAVTPARAALLSAQSDLMERVTGIWPSIQADLIADPEPLSELLAGGFSTSHVEAFFPPLVNLGIGIRPEEKLADSSGKWLARRVGIWSVTGRGTEGGEFSLGVVTPRLTRSSLFADPLFKANTESCAALLVRCLVLRSLLAYYRADSDVRVLPTQRVSEHRPFLKSIPARVGEKIPEASLAAAVLFVQSWPKAEDAYEEMERWASSRGDDGSERAILTVTREGFAAAHGAISRAVGRGESPEREDVNVLLPLAWDASSRVIRITLVKASDSA